MIINKLPLSTDFDCGTYTTVIHKANKQMKGKNKQKL